MQLFILDNPATDFQTLTDTESNQLVFVIQHVLGLHEEQHVVSLYTERE